MSSNNEIDSEYNEIMDTLYNTTKQKNDVNWSPQHEQILVDWGDKSTCYKWLHEKSHREYARKNRWFTIPVIIMSTFTGTANFAQERIPPEYVDVFTMGIGSISLVAGIITTIQQFLKISEMCESHRVSSIAWGKFHRNIKIELAKSPVERIPVTQMIKSSKEEYDRLIETSQSVPTHIIRLFKDTFSGGELKYDDKGIKIPLTRQQQIYEEITKPDMCDSIESIKNIIYKPIINSINKTHNFTNNTDSVNNIKIEIIESFINRFEKDKGRYPTSDEIVDNIDDDISIDIIESVLYKFCNKYEEPSYSSSPVYDSNV